MTQTPSSRPPHKSCGRCGARYDLAAWAALEPCGTLDEADTKPLVAMWPPSTVVDLRRCERCGVVLARLVMTD